MVIFVLCPFNNLKVQYVELWTRYLFNSTQTRKFPKEGPDSSAALFALYCQINERKVTL